MNQLRLCIFLIIMIFSIAPTHATILYSDDFNSNSIANYTATAGTWAVNTSTGELYNSVYATNAKTYYNLQNFSQAKYTVILNMTDFVGNIGFEYGTNYQIKLVPTGAGKLYFTRLSDSYSVINEMGYQSGHSYRIEVSWNTHNNVHIVNLTEVGNATKYHYVYYFYDNSSVVSSPLKFTLNVNNNNKISYAEVNDELDVISLLYPTPYSINNVNTNTNSNIILNTINQTYINNGYAFNKFFGTLNNYLYAISDDNCGLNQSTDSGSTWTSVYNFCTSKGVSIGAANTQSAVMNAGNYLVVLSNNSKLYRSNLNDPTTWNLVSSLVGSDPSIQTWSWYCTSDGWCVYGEYGDKGVGKTNYHVYLSQDYAATWTMIFNGSLFGTDITNMHVHQVFIDSSKRIYVALGDSPNMAVYVSSDSGSSFSRIELDSTGTLAAVELENGNILFGREDGSVKIYDPSSTTSTNFSTFTSFFHDYVSNNQTAIPYFGRVTRYLSYFYKDPISKVIYATTSSSDKDLDSSIYATVNGIDYYRIANYTNYSSSGSSGGHSFGAITPMSNYLFVPTGNMPSYYFGKLTYAETLFLANGDNGIYSGNNLTKTRSYQSGVQEGIVGFTDSIIRNPQVTLSSYNLTNYIVNPEFATGITGWNNETGWVYNSTSGKTNVGSAFLNTSIGHGNLSQDITSYFNNINGSIGYYRLSYISNRINGTANIVLDITYSDGGFEQYIGTAISATSALWAVRSNQFSVRKNKTISSIYLNITSSSYNGTINIDDVSVWYELYDAGMYSNGLFNTNYGSKGIYAKIDNTQYNSSTTNITTTLSGLYDRVNISDIIVVDGTQRINVSVVGELVAKGTNIILTTDKTNINIDTVYSDSLLEIYQDYSIELTENVTYNINTSRTTQGRLTGLTLIPSLSSINFTPILWNIAGNYSKIFNESSTNAAVTTQHIFSSGSFPANQVIQINRDGSLYEYVTSDGVGGLSWTYSGGYSTHLFEMTLAAASAAYVTTGCQNVGDWGTIGFGLIAVLLIVIAGSLAIGWLTGNQTNVMEIAKFTGIIVIVVIVGLIGVALVSPIFDLLGC